MQEKIEDLIKERVLIIDGAMGTQLQAVDIESKFWQKIWELRLLEEE